MKPYCPQDVFGNAVEALRSQEALHLRKHIVGVEDLPGVYLLYYFGPFHLYEEIAAPKCKVPIYVGATKQLRTRTRQHWRSLTDVSNLEVVDFRIRVLHIHPSPWRFAIEDAVIDSGGTPLWNRKAYEGFGNSGPRDRRHGEEGPSSKWDQLHPGRKGTIDYQGPIDRLVSDAKNSGGLVEGWFPRDKK